MVEDIRSDYEHLSPDDRVYYFHEYVGRGVGFNGGPVNSWISNLKKAPSSRLSNPDAWGYKQRAIDRAADYLRRAFPAASTSMQNWTVVPIPPSRVRGDPDFDDRLFSIVEAAGCFPNVAELLVQTSSRESEHSGLVFRHPPEYFKSLWRINPSISVPVSARKFMVFDDVIRQGCQFRTAKDLILQAYPDAQVVGVFLTRCVDPPPDSVEDLF